MVTNYQRVDSLQVKNLFPYEIETMEIMQRLVFHCYPVVSDFTRGKHYKLQIVKIGSTRNYLSESFFGLQLKLGSHLAVSFLFPWVLGFGTTK